MTVGRVRATSSVAFEVLIMNCETDFINLFIFNYLALNINLFIFNCLTSNFYFLKKNVFRKKERTAVYERAFVVLDFKLIRENDDLLSSRHKHIFEVPHCVHEYTKMQIPKERYLTNMARTFWGTWSASALKYLGVDHFGRYRTKIYEKEEKL